MNCWTHTELPSEAICKSCQKPYDGQCLILVGETEKAYCKSCYELTLTAIRRAEVVVSPLLIVVGLGLPLLFWLIYSQPDGGAMLCGFSLIFCFCLMGLAIHFRRFSNWKRFRIQKPFIEPTPPKGSL